MADFKTCPGCPSPKACKGAKKCLNRNNGGKTKGMGGKYK